MPDKRLLSSMALVAVAILATINDWACGIAVTVLIIGGLKEFFSLIEKKGIYIYKYFGIGVGSIIPLSIFFNFELEKLWGFHFAITKSWEFLFIVLALLSLIALQLRRRGNYQTIVSVSTTVFGILYIAWLFSFLIKIKFLPNGANLIAALVLVTKSGDIGAYLIGTRWGKTPLIIRVSPRKSVEGSIGGFSFCILAALSSRAFLPFSFLHLAALGIFLGLLGQLGDLSESLIKRDCQVKDTGNFFPGLGGFLDVMDSLLFTAPAFYFYMSIILK